jgi:6-phosphogluconolactonase
MLPKFDRHARKIMITGGRSAQFFYKKWYREHIFQKCSMPVDLYFSDERCVPSHHADSNLFSAKKTIFADGLPRWVTLHPMAGDAADLDSAANYYADLLPDSLDFMLLSMGDDGHIASLFPNSTALFEAKRKVVPIVGPKAPHRRLTITPPVIKSAKQVYILAIGDERKRKYEEALLDPEDISAIPARLVLDRTWIFDLDEEIDLCPKP